MAKKYATTKMLWHYNGVQFIKIYKFVKYRFAYAAKYINSKNNFKTVSPAVK